MYIRIPPQEARLLVQVGHLRLADGLLDEIS